MKAEVKKAIEDAAENIFGISRDAADGIEGDGAQEVRARVNLVRQGLDALREDAEALGECFDGGDLPFFCRLVETLLVSCDWGGDVSAHFFTNGDDGEECAWEECREVTIECCDVSNGSDAADLGCLIGQRLAELCGLGDNTEHDRDGRHETTWIHPAVTLGDVFCAAARDGRIRVLKAKISRFEGYCAHDRDLVERTGKVKYVNRLKNHEDKLARARAELAGLESAGK